jgi:arylsulfatase A-like enzyme
LKKWIAAWVGGLALLGLILVNYGPQIVLRYPELIGIASRLLDPIGPTVPVAWQPGPARAENSASERPPNVVMILVDDLGWNDLSWRGGGVDGGAVPTPNIDSLARDGVEFTMGYAGNATCAPSRAAIMTGRYPPRFGFESTPAPAAMGKMISSMQAEQQAPDQPALLFFEELMPEVPSMEQQGVPSSEITLAELLGEGGYRSLMLGKWHLGDAPGKRPNDQGFHEFLGFESGASLYGSDDDPKIVSAKQTFDPIDVFLWKLLPFAIRKDDGPRFTPPEYMTDYLSAQAVRAIEANRNRPFFLYLAYNAPHTPLQASQADYDALSAIGHHPTRVYGAMIRALDRGVGEVLEALKENGLEENTLVVFSSDNGGAHYVGIPGLNAPYRGWKMTFFEGGLHSPFFMKWPAQFPAGTQIDTPVAHIDLFATAAAAAGIPVPEDRVIDGVDLVPFARGESVGEAHDALFWRSGGLQVVLADGWKYQTDLRRGKRWLFDLTRDPTERNNRADQEPERAQALQTRLDAFNADMGPRHFPALIESPIPIDRTLADPYVPGEEWAYWSN